MASSYTTVDVTNMLVANGWSKEDARIRANEIISRGTTDSAVRTLVGAAIAEKNTGPTVTVPRSDSNTTTATTSNPAPASTNTPKPVVSTSPGTSAQQAAIDAALEAAKARDAARNIVPAGTAGNVKPSGTSTSLSTNTSSESTYSSSSVAVDPSAVSPDTINDPQALDHELDADEIANIRAQYPTMAHWLDHPEVGPILRQAVAEGWDSATLAANIEPTDWYQSTSASEREFTQRYERDPATLQREIDQQRFMLDSVSKTQGFGLSDDELTQLATDVIKYGYSEQEILRQLSAFARKAPGAPTDGLLAIEQSLRGMASAYMLKYDDATLKEYATRIFEGTWTKDAAKATFQQQAAQFYPHIADQLTKGITVEEYFTPIKARVASILEMNPADIDLTQGKWASLTQFVDDNGKMRAPTYAEIDQFARDQEEFGFTKGAIDAGYERMNSLFRTMGVLK